jgi:hypothetical protein
MGGWERCLVDFRACARGEFFRKFFPKRSLKFELTSLTIRKGVGYWVEIERARESKRSCYLR